MIIDQSRKEDICTHLGDDYERYLGAVVPPIFQNSLFVDLDNGDGKKYAYSRINNPTVEIVETKIAALEEGEAALCFGSGMAAITTGILYWLDSNSHAILVRNVYGPVRSLFETYLNRFGITTSYVSGTSIEEVEAALQGNTRLIYLESPVSNIFTLQDMAGISHLARAKGIATMIDNTWATPLFQNPLKFGIDMVVHTASKYLGGHSDIVAGVLITRKEITEQIMHKDRALLGGIMDPHQAWLLLRGIRTLPIRMQKHQENALKIALYLQNNPKIKQVMYPGLDSHPQYALGKAQMTGYSGLLSFVPSGTSEALRQFVKSLRYFQRGPSWGGYESLVSGIGINLSQEESQFSGIPQGTIRISIGLEHVDTLIEDLDAGLIKL